MIIIIYSIGFWLPIFVEESVQLSSFDPGYNLLSSKLWRLYSLVIAAMWTTLPSHLRISGKAKFLSCMCLPFLPPEWLRGFSRWELWRARGSIKMSGLYQVRWEEEWLCGPRGQVNNSEGNCLAFLVRHSQTHAALYLCIINPSHFSLTRAF